METNDFFLMAKDIINFKGKYTSDIKFRSAINRLYYGTFHLVQQYSNIHIPQNEIHRCHHFITEKIKDENFYSEYIHLLGLRNDADYNINKKKFRENDYMDALELKEVISTNLTGAGNVPYDDDDFFKKKYQDSH